MFQRPTPQNPGEQILSRIERGEKKKGERLELRVRITVVTRNQFDYLLVCLGLFVSV